MKKIFSIVFLFFLTFCKAQIPGMKIDTFANAAASSNQFVVGPSGVMNNGHPYVLGWNAEYPNSSFPIQFVRVDILTNQITTLRIDSSQYYIGSVSTTCFDSSGIIYFSGYYGGGYGHMYRLGLKDPTKIEIKDFGIMLHNLSSPSNGLALPIITLGRDGKIYYGTSGDSRLGWYDPVTDTKDSTESLDVYQNFVLGLAGDTDYVYAQIGQLDSIYLYSVRKSDKTKLKLASIPNSSRFGGPVAAKGFCEVNLTYPSYGNQAGFYYLYGGILHSTPPSWVTYPNATNQIQVIEVPDNVNYGPEAGKYYNTPVYDKVTSYLYNVYNYGFASPPIVDSVIVPHDSTLYGVGLPFFCQNDTFIYYKGNIQYGYLYKYNLLTKTYETLGSMPGNMYAGLVDNKNLGTYLSGYPSGVVVYYDFNKPWTYNKIYDGYQVPVSSTSNPKLVTYFRSYSNPRGEFSHAVSLSYFNDSLIVSSGDVIRTDHTIGIGTYNQTKDSAYGHPTDGYSGYGYSGDPVKYKKWMLFPNSGDTSICKIFYYNPITNFYDDSLIIPGFNNYGQIFVIGDLLYGFAPGIAYKVNLLNKKVIDSCTWTNQTTSLVLMPDNRLITNFSLPKTFYPYQITTLSGYSNFYFYKDVMFATNSIGQLVRISGIGLKYSINDPIGRYLYLSK